MANRRLVQMNENFFLEELKNSELNELEEKDLKRKEESIYEYELMKRLEVKKFELDSDFALDIDTSAILDITINNDIKLDLKFLENKFITIIIKIRLGKGVTLDLAELSNAKDLFKELHIDLDEGAKLLNSQFIINSKHNFTKVTLKKEAEYKLSSAYFANESNNFIVNHVQHLEEKSNSDLKIKGAAMNHSRITSDAIVEIEKEAINSSGHQEIKGIILDENSQINSEPILEIKNNLVSCSHGASISQVSKDIEFYMNSRGISKKDTIKLIVESFFHDSFRELESFDIDKLVEKVL